MFAFLLGTSGVVLSLIINILSQSSLSKGKSFRRQSVAAVSIDIGICSLQEPTKVEHSTVWEEASTGEGLRGPVGWAERWKAAQKQAWDLVD